MGAIEFYENEDPLDTEEWLVHTKIFKDLHYTGRQKVVLVAYMLRGVADTWWKTVCTPYYTIDNVINWETFNK